MRAPSTTASTTAIVLSCAPAFIGLAVVQFSDALAPLLAYRVPPDLGYSAHANPSLQLIQIACLGYLCAMYGRVLLRWQRSPVMTAHARAIAVGLVLACFALVPANSSDVLEYLGFGRLMTVYHLSPYEHTYGEVTDAFASLITWEEPIPYGPVVLPLFALASLLTSVHALLGVYALKAMWAGIHLLNASLVWRIARTLELDEDYAFFAFACNPLILWEQVGNGHNDGLLVLCGLTAVWLACRGRGSLALVAAFLAWQVKAPGVLWFAGILVLLVRQRKIRELSIGLAAVGIAAAVLLLLIPGALSTPVSVYTLWQYSEDSLHTLVMNGAQWLATRAHHPFDYADAFTLDRQVSGVAFACICAWRLIAIRDGSTLVREMGILLTVLILGYATSVQPWYIGWLVPFAALSESPVLRRTILACSISVIALYAFPYRLVEVVPARHAWTAVRLLVAFGVPLAVCLRERVRLAVAAREPQTYLLSPVIVDSSE